jgi:hypothetical protein
MEAKTGGRERNEPGSASQDDCDPSMSDEEVLALMNAEVQRVQAILAEPDDMPVCPNCGLAALPQLQFVIVQVRHWRTW